MKWVQWLLVIGFIYLYIYRERESFKLDTVNAELFEPISIRFEVFAKLKVFFCEHWKKTSFLSYNISTFLFLLLPPPSLPHTHGHKPNRACKKEFQSLVQFQWKQLKLKWMVIVQKLIRAIYISIVVQNVNMQYAYVHLYSLWANLSIAFFLYEYFKNYVKNLCTTGFVIQCSSIEFDYSMCEIWYFVVFTPPPPPNVRISVICGNFSSFFSIFWMFRV